jgi:uncharacterized RDD family membrane protein YckC
MCVQHLKMSNGRLCRRLRHDSPRGREMDIELCICNGVGCSEILVKTSAKLCSASRSLEWFLEPKALSDPAWYYLENETPTGPFSWQRLVDLSKAGLIGPKSLVWRDGTDSWIYFIDAMRAVQPIPPPLQPSSPPDHALLRELPRESAFVKNSSIVDESRHYPPPASSKVDASNARGWLTSPVTPWRRYGARMLDTTIHGILGSILLAFAWYSFAPISADKFFSFIVTPEGAILNIVLTVLFAAIIGGFIVGATGTSVGKAIFGIKILNPNAQAIGIVNGLKREFRVWLAGMGLGIPIITLFTMIAAYQKLKSDGSTTWDRDRNLVLYRPNGPFQYAMNALGVVLVIVVYGAVRALNDM